MSWTTSTQLKGYGVMFMFGYLGVFFRINFPINTISQERDESKGIHQRQPATPVQTSTHCYSHRRKEIPSVNGDGKKRLFAVCAPLWLIQLMPLEMSVSGCSGGLTLNSKAPTWYLSLQGRVGPFSSPTLGQQGKDAIRKHLFVTYMNNRKILRSCRCRFCIFCILTRKRFALFCCPGWALSVLTVWV